MTKGLREMHLDDLVVLAVALDDERKTIERAILKHGLADWTHLCDGRGWASVPARLYGITGIPSDVVIDAKGMIRGYHWREIPTVPKPSAAKN